MSNRTEAGSAAESRIMALLLQKKDMIRLSLSACVHCSLCSESCFKYRGSGGDPTYTPSYKAINTIGRIFRSRGRLTDRQYADIEELAWHKCVLCMRCYCPIGISVPSLIAAARSVCREKGVFRRYDGEAAT
jgi:Fe-S oxidoreductase